MDVFVSYFALVLITLSNEGTKLVCWSLYTNTITCADYILWYFIDIVVDSFTAVIYVRAVYICKFLTPEV